jgi:hypothetical protein
MSSSLKVISPADFQSVSSLRYPHVWLMVAGHFPGLPADLGGMTLSPVLT